MYQAIPLSFCVTLVFFVAVVLGLFLIFPDFSPFVRNQVEKAQGDPGPYWVRLARIVAAPLFLCLLAFCLVVYILLIFNGGLP